MDGSSDLGDMVSQNSSMMALGNGCSSPVTTEEHRIVDDGHGGQVVQIMVKDHQRGGAPQEEEEEEQDMEEMLEEDDEEEELVVPPPQKRPRLEPEPEVEQEQSSEVDSAPLICERYGCQLVRHMTSFLDKGHFCDITLLATKSNHSLPAHKLVLAANSSHLSALLLLGAESLDTLPVEVGTPALLALRDYFYTGNVQLDTEMASELLSVSVDWELELLEKACRCLGASDASHITQEAPGVASPASAPAHAASPAATADSYTLHSPHSMDPTDSLTGTNTDHHEQLDIDVPRDPFLGGTVKRELEDEGMSADSEPEEPGVTDELVGERVGVAEYDTLLGDTGRSPMLHGDEGESGSEVNEPHPLGSLQIAQTSVESEVKPEPEQTGTYGRMPVGVQLQEEDSVDEEWPGKTEDEEDASSVVASTSADSPLPASLGEASNQAGCLYRCYVCKVVFSDVQACLSHLSTDHGAKQNMVLSKQMAAVVEDPDLGKPVVTAPADASKDDVFYQCTSCKKHFADIDTCKAHIEKVHSSKKSSAEGSYHCYICQKTFSTVQEGRAHSLKEHCHPSQQQNYDSQIERLQVPVTITRRPYTRRSGGYSTPVSDVIDLSEVVPTGTDWDDYPFPNHPYQCNFCKLIFAKLDQCEQHIHETHNIDKGLVYVCYTRRKNRNKNKAKTTTPSPKVSPAVSVSSTSSLEKKKPSAALVCNVNGCGQVVTKSLDLTYHKYLEHNIPLPSWTSTYNCPLCGRLCRTKAALSTHLSRMHIDEEIPDEPIIPPTKVDSPAQ